MQIWVDADACPVVIKQILFKAAQRWQVKTTLVANQTLQVPASVYIASRQVPKGFDVADNYIVTHARADDLVITADIPLAAEVINNNVHVLSPHGERHTKDTISERLTMRDMMQELRDMGIETSKQKEFSMADRKAFANQLDKFLAANSRS